MFLRLKQRGHREAGQMTIEYALMFTVIVAIVLWAGVSITKPSVNKLFEGTGNILNASANRLEEHASNLGCFTSGGWTDGGGTQCPDGQVLIGDTCYTMG